MRNASWLGLVIALGLVFAGGALSADDIHHPQWVPPSVDDVAAARDGLSFDRFVDASYEQCLLRFPQTLTHRGMARQLGVRNDHLNDVWPGQSTSYMIGFLRLLDLRSQVQTALGEAFDLAEFHTLLLENGSLPLELFDTIVQEYISKHSE